MKTDKHELRREKSAVSIRVHLCIILCALLLSACNELQRPKTEPFYAETTPPPKQEFRWSNGKMPKSFDPALAHAAPEADFVRALYEGLTDTDSKTLEPIPAVAAKWTASEDFKTWTFYLRKDARWSNGEPVTAQNFARSWKRLVELGDKVQQRGLLKNIVGMDTENVLPVFSNEQLDVVSEESPANRLSSEQKPPAAAPPDAGSETAPENPPLPKTEVKKPERKAEKNSGEPDPFGVVAVNELTLKVSLLQPDKNFASLVAHPIFRPVYEDGREFEAAGLIPNIVTNGAFRIKAIERDKITLNRSEQYWSAQDVELETVHFVPTESAENALEAYRAGEIDAVTNADFKPLALKLLTPFDDFRRTTHGALNFYEFNPRRPQFNDWRVRKALAMAVERERLTEDEMDGASRPAFAFSPFSNEIKIPQSAAESQRLLAEAGFAGGKGFPPIRLLINRNDVQRRIARAVAKMWKKHLNVDTEILVKDQEGFVAAFQNGEFDIVRRGIVLPTTDETANMLVMFPVNPQPKKESIREPTTAAAAGSGTTVSSDNQILSEKTAESNLNIGGQESPAEVKPEAASPKHELKEPFLTERQALEMLPAIPLYFPTSYSLVKPYVEGFETNALDAPSLKNVKINNNWQPANQKLLSNNQN